MCLERENMLLEGMEVSQRIDRSLNLRVQTVSGVVAEEELLGYLRQLYAAPDFEPGLNVIWDFRAADLSQFSLSKVVKVRDYIEKFLNKPKPQMAALVVSSSADFALTSMFETLMKSPSVSTRVFFDILEAEDWVAQSKRQ